MNIQLDFTNVQEFSNLPLGKNLVKVSKVEQVKASTGTDMLRITFTDKNGNTGLDNFALTEKALWKLKSLLVALFRTNISGRMDLNTDAMIGKTCFVVVGEEEYVKNDGTPATRQKLDNYTPVTDADTLNVTPTPAVAPSIAPSITSVPSSVAPTYPTQPIAVQPTIPTQPTQVATPKRPWEL